MIKHLLFVDDNPELVETFKDILEDAGYGVTAVESCADAERYLNETALPDAMLIDYNLPDGVGTELARDIRYRYPSLPLILITGEEAASMEADRQLFRSILIKPVDPALLLTLLDTL